MGCGGHFFESEHPIGLDDEPFGQLGAAEGDFHELLEGVTNGTEQRHFPAAAKNHGHPDSDKKSWSDAFGVTEDVDVTEEDDWSALMDNAVGAESEALCFARSASAPNLLGPTGTAGGHGSWEPPQLRNHGAAQAVAPISPMSLGPPLSAAAPRPDAARHQPGVKHSDSWSLSRSASAPNLDGLETFSSGGISQHLLEMHQPGHYGGISVATKMVDLPSPVIPAKLAKRRVIRTAEERKQRRLETNRAAAKRAYYRRQGKMNATKYENGRLVALADEQAERIKVYEVLLQKLAIDPAAWVQHHAPGLAAKTKRRLEESHNFSDSEDEYGGGGQTKQRRGGSGASGAESCSDEGDREGSDIIMTPRVKEPPTSTRSGRAVRRPRPADQAVSHHEDVRPQSAGGR